MLSWVHLWISYTPAWKILKTYSIGSEYLVGGAYMPIPVPPGAFEPSVSHLVVFFWGRIRVSLHVLFITQIDREILLIAERCCDACFLSSLGFIRGANLRRHSRCRRPMHFFYFSSLFSPVYSHSTPDGRFFRPFNYHKWSGMRSIASMGHIPMALVMHTQASLYRFQFTTTAGFGSI